MGLMGEPDLNTLLLGMQHCYLTRDGFVLTKACQSTFLSASTGALNCEGAIALASNFRPRKVEYNHYCLAQPSAIYYSPPSYNGGH